MELTSRGLIASIILAYCIVCQGKAVLEEKPKYYGGYEYNYNFQNDKHEVRPLYDYSHMLSTEENEIYSPYLDSNTYPQPDFIPPNPDNGELDQILENYYIPKKLDSIYGGVEESNRPKQTRFHATPSEENEQDEYEDVYDSTVVSENQPKTEAPCDDCYDVPIVVNRKKVKPTRKSDKFAAYTSAKGIFTDDYDGDLRVVGKKKHAGKSKPQKSSANSGNYNRPTAVDSLTKKKPIENKKTSVKHSKPIYYEELDSVTKGKTYKQKSTTKSEINGYSRDTNIKVDKKENPSWMDQSESPDYDAEDFSDLSETDEAISALDDIDSESLTKKGNVKNECNVHSKSSNGKTEGCSGHENKHVKPKTTHKPKNENIPPKLKTTSKPKDKNKSAKPKTHKPKDEYEKPDISYEKPIKVSHVKYDYSGKDKNYKTAKYIDDPRTSGHLDLEVEGQTETKSPGKEKCTLSALTKSSGGIGTCLDNDFTDPSNLHSVAQKPQQERFPKPYKSQYNSGPESTVEYKRDSEGKQNYSYDTDGFKDESSDSMDSGSVEIKPLNSGSDLSVEQIGIDGNANTGQVNIPQDENLNFDNAGSGLVAEEDIGKLPVVSDESDKLRSLSFINSNIISLLSNPNAKDHNLKPCVTRHNESGFCRYVQQCQVANIANSLEKLLNNACVVDEVFIGVCCPEFPVETVRVHWDNSESTTSGNDAEDSFSHETKDCGTRSKEASRIRSWPWKAPLVSMSNGKIFCGGVIIGNQYVLTAAHCTTKIPKNQILVRIGQHDESSGDDFIVTEIKRHAQYNSRTLQNDIALLKLGRRVSHSDHTGVVCLPDEDDDHDENKGDKAMLLGWKRVFGENPIESESLEVMSHEKCRKMMNTNVPNSVLCTEARKEDEITCNADSGAPLVIEDDGKYEVIGILSWNRNDCDQRFPSIFSRVSNYVKWIKRHAV